VYGHQPSTGAKDDHTSGSHQRSRPVPAGEVQEKQIEAKKFKLCSSLGQEMQDQIVEVIVRHMNAFAWSSVDMPDIDLDFLCHRLTINEKVRPVIQRRRNNCFSNFKTSIIDKKKFSKTKDF